MTTMAIGLPVSELPNPEVLAPAPDYSVEQMDRELRAAASAYRKTLARIAYYAFRMYLCEGWTTLGYPAGTAGENRYREEVLHIPRSTYFKARNIGKVLHTLELSEMEMIRPTNLELLLSVSPTVKNDFPWIKEAKMLPPQRFAELVAQRNKNAGSEKEPFANFSVRVPFLAKQAIETMLHRFQSRHEIKSAGRALELMVADQHDSSSLLGSVEEARRLMDGVVKSQSKYGRLTDEAHGWLLLAKKVLDEASEEAVQTARAESESSEEAV